MQRAPTLGFPWLAPHSTLLPFSEDKTSSVLTATIKWLFVAPKCQFQQSINIQEKLLSISQLLMAFIPDAIYCKDFWTNYLWSTRLLKTFVKWMFKKKKKKPVTLHKNLCTFSLLRSPDISVIASTFVQPGFVPPLDETFPGVSILEVLCFDY